MFFISLGLFYKEELTPIPIEQSKLSKIVRQREKRRKRQVLVGRKWIDLDKFISE